MEAAKKKLTVFVGEENRKSGDDPTSIFFLLYDENHSELIEKTEKELFKRNTDTLAVVIISVPDVEPIFSLIKEGFLPKSQSDYVEEAFIDYFAETYSPEEIKFWSNPAVINNGDPMSRSPIDMEEVYNKMLSFSVFLYATIGGWKQYALKTANSFPLALYAKHLLYPSMRPVNDMAMFRHVTSALYTRAVKIDDYLYSLKSTSFDGKEIDLGLGIPVTRYSDGMNKGLYYNGGKNKKFCGTFYYYEPSSTIFLTFSTHAIYKNKHEAVKEFTSEDHPDYMRADYAEFSEPLVNMYYNPESYKEEYLVKFPEDLRMTPREYYAKVKKEPFPPQYENLPERKYYIGKKIGFYAVEDDYDQDLCSYSKQQGHEVVILTHMVGSRQIVTEVLDTRERSQSFGALVYSMV